MRRWLPILAPALAVVALALAGCEGQGRAASPAAPPAASPFPPVDPAQAATLIVRVKLHGAPPANPDADVSIDTCCKAAHPDGLKNERVKLSADGELANVFVEVSRGLEHTGYPAPAGTPTLAQKGCLFSPRVVAVRPGERLTIQNGDPTFHNVLARPERNAGFNIGFVANDPPQDVSFVEPELGIPLACNVHPWMQAWCCVADSPVFGVTDEKGTVALEPLPPGALEITTWHEVYGKKVTKVEPLGARESRTIEITYEAETKK